MQCNYRVLKGHTDDVSRFVVKDGLLLSGGRDATLLGWSADTGEFLFSRRYCHNGEVSAVDACVRNLGVVVTGSRDCTVKVWSLDSTREQQQREANNNNRPSCFPDLYGTVDLGDRVWSLACDPYHGAGRVAVGSAGLCGVPALHLLDLSRLDALPVGQNVLKKGAGVLDIQWHGRDTFISCGYDTFARMWDTRTPGGCVRAWEEPFDESVYCFSTDGHVTLVTGTARHGLCRLWDLRCRQPVSMYYARHAHHGQSSPVYSVAFDQSNLYVALDQSLNLLSFDDQNESICVQQRQRRPQPEQQRRRQQQQQQGSKYDQHHHHGHQRRHHPRNGGWRFRV